MSETKSNLVCDSATQMNEDNLSIGKQAMRTDIIERLFIGEEGRYS